MTLQRQLGCSAALGWLELGNWLEAYNELESLPPEQRTHPDALKLYCRVWEAAEKWPELEMIAEGAMAIHPDEPAFCSHSAWAKHMQGFSVAAADQMMGRPSHLPTDAEFCFRLACISSALGFPTDARNWLDLAFRKSDEPDKLKLRALEQEELRGMWVEAQSVRASVR